jgi:hypothetical protein
LNAANWAPGVVPGGNDELVFRGTALTETENGLPAGTTFHPLLFLSSNFFGCIASQSDVTVRHFRASGR